MAGIIDVTGMSVGGNACRGAGAFGTGIQRRELHTAWCSECEAPVLTRHSVKVLCAACREGVKRRSEARVKAREALALYWIRLGLVT